jgi:hypothetical protein
VADLVEEMKRYLGMGYTTVNRRSAARPARR